MAGGTFKTMNKVLPGAYINVQSTGQAIQGVDTTRGVVFTKNPVSNWGPYGVFEVTAKTDFFALFGKTIADPALAALKLALGQAPKLLVFGTNSATKSAGDSAVLPWTFEAKYGGSLGDTISVVATPDANSIGKLIIQTLVGTQVVDTQSVSLASQLQANDFVVPAVIETAQADDGAAMIGDIATAVTVQLSGAAAGSADASDDFVAALQVYDYNTILAEQGATVETLNLIGQAAISLRDEQGKKVQAVIPYNANALFDHEGVIIVQNGVVLEDGTQVQADLAAAFAAGATAAAEANESLTYREFPGAVDALPRYTEDQQIGYVNAGRFVFIASRNTAKVLTDINSLHTFTDEKNSEFRKNRVLRVLDEIANDTRIQWEDNFIGQVTNDAAGRDLFKANRAEFLDSLQAIGAIQNFTADNITVEEGANKDTIIATIAVQPTDAMEKLYLTVTAG
jgi:hypothetical protein